MSKFRLFSLLTVLALLLSTVAPLAASPDALRSTQYAPRLTQVNVAGSFEHLIGGADWSNNDALTNLADANGDGVWKYDVAIPTAGAYEYKIVEDGDWSKAYPAANVPFTVSSDGKTVKWYYDPADHYVADNANQVIAAAVGNFASKVGGADWAPDNLKTLLKGPDGKGNYVYTAKNLPGGKYEYKVALNESWDVNYGEGGVQGGPNIQFPIAIDGSDVRFTYDPVSNIISHEVLPPSGGLITIDGTKDKAYGKPVASDPQGDINEPNLDLRDLYIVDDANNYYIGLDAFATNWGMTYGIYIDTDQKSGSGAATDPWGRAVNAVDKNKPEYALYVWHKDDGTLENAQLIWWDGAAWQSNTLVGVGGAGLQRHRAFPGVRHPEGYDRRS